MPRPNFRLNLSGSEIAWDALHISPMAKAPAQRQTHQATKKKTVSACFQKSVWFCVEHTCWAWYAKALRNHINTNARNHLPTSNHGFEVGNLAVMVPYDSHAMKLFCKTTTLEMCFMKSHIICSGPPLKS